MLSWLGLTNAEKNERQFFGNVKKETITLILLTALIILYGVKTLLTYLIPSSYLGDPVVGVLPGTLGVLVSIVYVLILERLQQDKNDKKSSNN